MLVCRPPAYPLLMRLLSVGISQTLEAVKTLCGHLPCHTRFAFSIYTARWESFLEGGTMNRGPFIHGWYRFSQVRNAKNRRYKKTSLKRQIINWILFALGAGILIFSIIKGIGPIILAGAIMFLGLGSIPFITSVGKNMLMYEHEIAINQKRAEIQLDFDVKRVKIGYVLIFLPIYLAMLACFFIPVHDAWIVPYIPICVFNIISVLLTENTLYAFDFSTKKYKWIHTLLYIGIFVVGALIRIFIMYPIIDARA